MDTITTFRVHRDEQVNDVTVKNDITVGGLYKFTVPLGVNGAATVDMSGGFYPDNAGSLAAFGATSLRFLLPYDIQAITLLVDKTTTGNVGTLTFTVNDATGTAAPGILSGSVDSAITLGATNPAYGNITYTFDQVVPANTAFTIEITTSASATATYRICMYALLN